MANTFEENFFKQFLDSVDEEREVFSLLADCIASRGKEQFKAMLEKGAILKNVKELLSPAIDE